MFLILSYNAREVKNVTSALIHCRLVLWVKRLECGNGGKVNIQIYNYLGSGEGCQERWKVTLLLRNVTFNSVNYYVVSILFHSTMTHFYALYCLMPILELPRNPAKTIRLFNCEITSTLLPCSGNIRTSLYEAHRNESNVYPANNSFPF